MQIKHAKPKEKQDKFYDGGGLSLMTRPVSVGQSCGGKHWRVKYTQANGKEATLSFGAFSTREVYN